MGNPTLEEDDENKGTMKHFIMTQLDKFFIGHIPIDSFKDLPPTYMYYFGTVAYMATICLFIYFTKTSYDQSIEQPYISIETGGGATCNSVPITISDSYLADSKGNWIGTAEFVYSDAPFVITFKNFQVDTESQYTNMMLTFQQGLKQIGTLSESQNLAQNLVYWMSYLRYYDVSEPSLTNFTSVGHGQLQVMELAGNPAEVFDLSYIQGHIISKAGYCTQSAFAYYDQANGVFVTNQNYSSFITEPACVSAINPLSFGYYPSIDQNVFQLSLDVYSFATALAVNKGILQIADLGVASSEYFEFSYDNVTYRTGQYFDIRYPMMSTIICIQNLTVIPSTAAGVTGLCMLQAGQTLALPVFNHFGTSYEFPSFCDCSTNGHSDACQTFNLLAGLLFYPADPDSRSSTEKQILSNSGIFSLLVLVAKSGGYHNFNKASYNATYAAAAPAYGNMSDVLNTASWRKKAFAFCTQATISCSILVFNAFDELSKKVSPYKFQLTNGSCYNSIAVYDEYWNKIAYNPPTALTQSYYECYQGSESALFSALGIASGNTSLAVPLIVTAILPLLYLLLVAIRQVPPKEEYSDPEKQQAIEILSILLLRLRDGKTRGVKKNGVLMRLVKELIAAAKEEGGFPDSDDEDEEEGGVPVGSPRASRRSTVGGGRKSSSGNRKKSFKESLDAIVDSDDEEEVGAAPATTITIVDDRKKSDENTSRTSQQFRRSSAANKIRRIDTGKERKKMAVFTRQLEEPTKRRKSGTTTRDSTAATSTIAGIFGGSRNSTYSGSKETELTVVYSDDANNPLSLSHYQNANSVTLSKDINIMNSQAMGCQPVNKFSRALTGEDIDLLADDLIKLFGETLKEGNKNPSASKETSASFLQGKQLSAKLAKVVLSDLLERDDKSIFFKLSNALCMQASIEMKVEMKQIGSQYADKVAYNIGGKVLTITNLDSVM